MLAQGIASNNKSVIVAQDYSTLVTYLENIVDFICFTNNTIPPRKKLSYRFLQRVSIACYAERCISHSKSVRLSVCPSDRLSHAGTESKRLKLRSWDLHWRIAP